MKADFGVVFCGGGPATIGPFVCAARWGRFADLLARRVLIVEQDSRIGGGSLRHYRITSNSLGGSSLEGLDGIPPGGPFDSARRGPTIDELRQLRHVHVPLKLVGAFLDSLGVALFAGIGMHQDCAVMCRSSVRRITVNVDGTLAITIASGGAERVIGAERAVIAMGGRPPDYLEQLEILPGLTLAPYADKLQHASALLDERLGLPGGLLHRLKASGHVVIVGGSHSAWSSAWVLLREPGFWTHSGTPPRVTLLHRSPIRLFALTSKEAEAEEIAFDPVRDICPLSGRVNRAGGLKGDARVLAQRMLSSDEDSFPLQLISLSEDADPGAVRAALDEADMVIAATGYQARLPDLVNDSGDRISVDFSSAGLVVTNEAEIVSAGGRVFPQLLAYGLGVGIRASERVGGEPSYKRAITSSWLYQHDVGEIVLRSLLRQGAGASRSEAHTSLAW